MVLKVLGAFIAFDDAVYKGLRPFQGASRLADWSCTLLSLFLSVLVPGCDELLFILWGVRSRIFGPFESALRFVSNPVLQ